ncbi:MAG: DMT family transporter [Pseudobdellovibrionaceae bacterium]
MTSRRQVGVFQVLFAGTCFGFLGIFGRWASQNQLSIGELLSYRFVLASSLLFIYLIIFQRKMIVLPWKQIVQSLLLGVFGYAVFSTLYFKSIQELSVALAAMLLFTFPLYVSLGAHFFLKHQLNRRQWSTLAFTFAGLVILLWGDLEIKKVSGIFWGLGAAVSYSIYVLVSGQIQKEIAPVSSSLYVSLGAAIALLIFHQPSLSQILELNLPQSAIIVGISLFCSILPMSLFLAGLQKMKSSEASVLVTIEPVVAALAGYLILGETITALQFVGGFIVLWGLYLHSQTST